MLEDKDLLSIQEVHSKVEKAYAARQKYRHQTNARIQQNSGAATAVLLRLMADSATPASVGSWPKPQDFLDERLRLWVFAVAPPRSETLEQRPETRFGASRHPRTRQRGLVP